MFDSVIEKSRHVFAFVFVFVCSLSIISFHISSLGLLFHYYYYYYICAAAAAHFVQKNLIKHSTINIIIIFCTFFFTCRLSCFILLLSSLKFNIHDLFCSFELAEPRNGKRKLARNGVIVST